MRHRKYLLVVLLAILASNYLDRMALGLLLEGIRKELSLSDTQLGLLTRIAFALFHAVLGIPIARWADRGNRVTIISVTAMLGVSPWLCAARPPISYNYCSRAYVSLSVRRDVSRRRCR